MMDFLKGTVTPQDWAAVAGIVGATLAVAAAFYFLVYSGQQEQLLTIEADNQQVLADLTQARQVRDEIEQLREETNQIEELVTQFEQRLPSTREIPTLIRQFEMMASEEDVSVNFQDLTRNVDMRKETIPYRVVAYGNFHQITNFINRLERFRRYLKITDLNIGPEEKGIATATFTLNTYRFIKSGEDA